MEGAGPLLILGNGNGNPLSCAAGERLLSSDDIVGRQLRPCESEAVKAEHPKEITIKTDSIRGTADTMRIPVWG
jgi:hypothetical protein